jgi:putative transposase
MFYRRKLPHWHADPCEESFLFITWRLAGSLPQTRNLAKAGIAIAETPGKAFVAIDRQTDRATVGPVWLKDDRIARLVRDALHYGEQERHFYNLRAWVIMPNHVHVLLQPKVSLPTLTRWLKGATARKANLVLGRTGKPFWQDESFDHRVRSSADLDRIVRYIENNPVSAGFVAEPADWPWSSARLTDESVCPTSHRH